MFFYQYVVSNYDGFFYPTQSKRELISMEKTLSLGNDLKELEKGVQIISGTPGWVFDLIRIYNLHTSHLKCLIVHEADAMLNKGFEEQIYDIYRFLPPSIAHKS